jgi:hypothetical protein
MRSMGPRGTEGTLLELIREHDSVPIASGSSLARARPLLIRPCS